MYIRGGLIGDVRAGKRNESRHDAAARLLKSRPNLRVLDYRSHVIGPGLIDLHVHMNEPGREDWEGMASATRAAAAGGITTVIDMPLNSDPCTTNVEELRRKVRAALEPNKTMVDVGFWAGLVPENSYRPSSLRNLVKKGALGFKAFMSPSGIDDFPNVSPGDIASAVKTIHELDVPLLVHAEIVDSDVPPIDSSCDVDGASSQSRTSFASWLDARPARFEQNAAKALIGVLDDLRDTLESNKKNDKKKAKLFNKNFRIHVVHVGDAEALSMIHEAKQRGLPISAEACPHYLLFDSTTVADGDTRFKCAPPFRDPANRDLLVKSLVDGWFDTIGSDHSPSPPSMKLLTSGDFMGAWGGIPGLQYSLPASWDVISKHNLSPGFLHRLWSTNPANIAGLERQKGVLSSGKHADIVVWDPEAYADTSETSLYHKHKVTPYADMKLKGKVVATFVKGSLVFSDFDVDERAVEMSSESCGKPILYRSKSR